MTSPVDDPRFVGYRRRLIEEIRSKGVDDLEILSLFDRVPRHLFLPEGVQPMAYDDRPLPIGHGQTASQPSLQAYYVQVLRPGPDDTVLEIGTGCGFLTAILAHLAERVYSVERIRDLSAGARRSLDALKLQNVALLVGDGTIGWRKYAPFQVVVVSAAAPRIPRPLLDQLADPGRMLVPVGDRTAQKLVLVRKSGGKITREELEGECTFVPLLGRYAFDAERER